MTDCRDVTPWTRVAPRERRAVCPDWTVRWSTQLPDWADPCADPGCEHSCHRSAGGVDPARGTVTIGPGAR